jgi:hypothetical protein
MTRTTDSSFSETVSHLASILAHQEALLDPDFDTRLDDLDREFAELRMTQVA